jgi:UPF0271 protein
MKTVDLNCDMGEGCGNDAELMRYITSANIACGFHAGNPTTMRQTAEMALQSGVAIGAHPSYRDTENFGRTPMDLAAREVFDIVVEQVAAMSEVCRSIGTRLNHVKPHGALYNQAAKNPELSAAIADAVRSVGDDLIFFGLAGSIMIFKAEELGLRTASEVFADRTYQSDGSLTPRTQADALIEEERTAIAQVLGMVNAKSVTSTDGSVVPIIADTICIHGDGKNAVAFAKAVRSALLGSGIAINAI